MESKALVPGKCYPESRTLVKGTPEHQLAQEVKEKIIWVFVEIIKQVISKGIFTLLNRPRTPTSINPLTTTEPSQSDFTKESLTSNLGFLQCI